ncbi:MAG: SDR family NAD(P)-dependent oxidoreductase [Pseudomonadota bacterium]
MSETWMILGASSAMARAFARSVAGSGSSVLLGGRDEADIAAQAADCMLRGADFAEAFAFDARDPTGYPAIVSRARKTKGTLNVAVFVGSMPAQAEIDAAPDLIGGTVDDSFVGPATLLQMLAPILEERGSGTVVGVGSVAGDRGRVGNYVYGAAKAGFHTYLSGLRNRLTRSGAHVVTVKPGFVDTGMTWGLDGMFLVASPDAVARDILKAAEKRRDVIYTPFFWRWIMLIIRMIPEPIFKKLSI